MTFLFSVDCRSQEWRLIPEEERKKLGLVFSDDGEFWLVPASLFPFVVYITSTCLD